MDNLSQSVASSFISSYQDAFEKVHTLCDKLTEEQFWTRPFSYGNSFGHLTLHIIGNLNHFIGARMANTGFVRDREREFSDQTNPSKAAVLSELDQAVSLVVETIKSQTPDDWSRKYEATDTPSFIQDRFGVFLRCATHFHHHVGQMIYLEKKFLDR